MKIIVLKELDCFDLDLNIPPLKAIRVYAGPKMKKKKPSDNTIKPQLKQLKKESPTSQRDSTHIDMNQ